MLPEHDRLVLSGDFLQKAESQCKLELLMVDLAFVGHRKIRGFVQFFPL